MHTNTELDIHCSGVLKFFGTLTASVTHELNNSIGIINENAGLLEDLGLMAKGGMEPDIDRWMEITQKITGQVKHTHNILKDLSKFAHTTDYTESLVNPDELLNLVASLLKKRLSEKNVTARVITPDESFDIHTCPFLFLYLTGASLIHAVDHADQNKKIVISTDQDEKKLCITFSGITNKSDMSFLNKKMEKILNMLGWEMKFPENQGKFLIFINKAN